MNDLIVILERAEQALFALSHGLRHQVSSEVLSDPKNSIMKAVADARAAVAAAACALEKAGK